MSLESSPSDALLPDRRFVHDLFVWLAPHYDSTVHLYTFAQDLRWKHVLLEKLKPRRGEAALDLACGTGLLSNRLSGVLGENAVVGLDRNRDMLRAARHTFAASRRVLANSECLPFRSKTFDLVTAGYLFKYARLDRLAHEVRRVLRPGGRFGGYDFSRPVRDTMSGRLYAQYLNHALPWLGRRRDPPPNGGERRRWTDLLEFLSSLAPSSGWEDRIVLELRKAGFVDISRIPSLGGAITWVWARLTPPEGSEGTQRRKQRKDPSGPP